MLKINCRYPFFVVVENGNVKLLIDRPVRNKSQWFEVATDSSLGRFALMDLDGIPPFFSSDCTMDQYCTIGKAYKRVILSQVKTRAEDWLQLMFREPQVIPIPDLSGDQLIRAIDLHYPGGWNSFFEMVLENLDAKQA